MQQSCQLAQALLHTDGKDPDVKSAAVEPNQDEASGPTMSHPNYGIISYQQRSTVDFVDDLGAPWVSFRYVYT